MGTRRILVILDGSNSRYICSCGDEDKAFQRDIKGRAENHNTRRHGDRFDLDIMEVEKEPLTDKLAEDLEQFKKNWAEKSGQLIGDFIKKIETKEIK